MIRRSDIDDLKDWIESIMDQKLGLETGQTLDDKLKYLPSRDDFYTESDKLMGGLKKIDEEITILSDMKRQVNNHQDVLEKVGKKLNISVVS
ncbi:MAG TPA: hypothetical protein VLE44_02865 [Candidatus Saccharimonadales bacterium]|nr:hypothetical protein [Candidatus Saccharimonadales bacterium]